jgi:hypothetical protein
MAISLYDIAKVSTSKVRAGIILNIVDTSVLLGNLPMESLDGDDRYDYTKEGRLPQSATRQYNAAYSSKDHGDFEPGSVHLKLLGGEFEIDRQKYNSGTKDGERYVAKQTSMWARAISLDWKKLIIKGNSQSNAAEPDGLEVLVSKLDSSQTIDFVSTAGSKISAVSSTVLVDNINNLIDATNGVGLPQMLICNRTILGTMQALVLAGSNEVLANIFKYEFAQVPSPRGGMMTTRIGMWNGIIPMIPVDFDSQGTEIMQFNETSGDGTSSSVCTSIYAVVVGDGALMGLQKESKGPDIFVRPSNIGSVVTIEWPLGLVAEHNKCIARLRGIISE